jgi:hypothetical protein
MTLQYERILPDRSTRISLRDDPAPASRRSLTPRAPRSGSVDGAWWPRSTDLVAELADLLALFAGRAPSTACTT